jgi:hypothetical protein
MKSVPIAQIASVRAALDLDGQKVAGWTTGKTARVSEKNRRIHTFRKLVDGTEVSTDRICKRRCNRDRSRFTTSEDSGRGEDTLDCIAELGSVAKALFSNDSLVNQISLTPEAGNDSTLGSDASTFVQSGSARVMVSKRLACIPALRFRGQNGSFMSGKISFCNCHESWKSTAFTTSEIRLELAALAMSTTISAVCEVSGRYVACEVKSNS